MGVERNKNLFIWTSSNIDEIICELEIAGYNVKGVFGCTSQSVQLCGGISTIKEMVDTAPYTFNSSLEEARERLLPKFIETYSRLVRSVKKRRYGYNGHGQYYGSYDYYKNRLSLYMSYFSAIIDDLNIDAVWFFRPPHLGMDNALYEVCKAKNINVIVAWQSLFPDKFFYGTSLENIFSAKDGFGNDSGGGCVDSKLNLFYMKEGSGAKKKYISDILAIVSSFYYMFRQGGGLEFVGQKILNKDAKIKYSKKEVIFSRPQGEFIYFPLHLQPEATTSILGAGYSDQVDAIEKLSLKCPKDWTIILKENPKQDYKFRPKEFYNRVSRLHNVSWCNPGTPTSELVEKCKIVATITGTAGYEALLKNKPCLFFGNAWYQELSGAFAYNDNIDIKEVGEFSLKKEDFSLSLKRLVSSCGDGVLYSGYDKISRMEKGERNRMTVQSLIKIDCEIRRSGLPFSLGGK